MVKGCGCIIAIYSLAEILKISVSPHKDILDGLLLALLLIINAVILAYGIGVKMKEEK